MSLKIIFNLFIVSLGLCFLAACAPPGKITGDLGFNENRRVVILGENIEPSIALYYQKKYDALVWFTPFEGDVAHFAQTMIEAPIGPSKPMEGLIAQLQSINQTVGRWEIYIPKIAEKYFSTTLKHMQQGALSKARGTVLLIDSPKAKELETQVKRVTQGSFFVVSLGGAS